MQKVMGKKKCICQREECLWVPEASAMMGPLGRKAKCVLVAVEPLHSIICLSILTAYPQSAGIVIFHFRGRN